MKNIKNLLCILVGFILAIGISNAYNLNASLVTYDNKNTTLESDNVEGALEELEDSTISKKNQIIGALINKGVNINNNANYDNIIESINNLQLNQNIAPVTMFQLEQNASGTRRAWIAFDVSKCKTMTWTGATPTLFWYSSLSSPNDMIMATSPTGGTIVDVSEWSSVTMMLESISTINGFSFSS